MQFSFSVFDSKTRSSSWFCLSLHIQFAHKPWVFCLSLHIWKCWDIISWPRPPGRAMSWRKLLSLPPPSCCCWPVEGFQQCTVFVCECSGLVRRSLYRLIVYLVRLSGWYSLIGFLGLLNGFGKPVVVIYSVLCSGVKGKLMFAEVGFSVRARSGVAVLSWLSLWYKLSLRQSWQD